MRTLIYSIGLLISVNGLLAQSRQASDIPPANKREATVELGNRLSKLNVPFTGTIPETILNPFDPSAGKIISKGNRPESDRDLLIALAQQLSPRGTAELGGAPYLLLGQKRIKVGEKLSIPFENIPYEVEIIAIDRTTFTLKFNEEEYTRPVLLSNPTKPGKNP
jgi:hypothetical protein